MINKLVKLTQSHRVFRFKNLATARAFADRAEKPMTVLLGDDERFWVVSLGLGEKLIRAGHEFAL